MIPEPLFIDFEASGLHLNSYPVEVGWAIPNGPSEVHLIRPIEVWLTTPYDTRAEQIHGINLERLLIVGEPPKAVVRKLCQVAKGRRLYADNVGHDERWLAALLSAADVQPSADLKIWCANILFRRLAAERGIELPAAEAGARKSAAVTHKADDDARYLATVYCLLTQ